MSRQILNGKNMGKKIKQIWKKTKKLCISYFAQMRKINSFAFTCHLSAILSFLFYSSISLRFRIIINNKMIPQNTFCFPIWKTEFG